MEGGKDCSKNSSLSCLSHFSLLGIRSIMSPQNVLLAPTVCVTLVVCGLKMRGVGEKLLGFVAFPYWVTSK